MKNTLKKHADKLRFAIVGGLNTAIDFLVLFILVGFGLPTIASNFASTSTALIFSFFANKKFTFKSSSDVEGKHFAYFLVITLFGLWVIQPVIITIIETSLETTDLNSKIILFIGKILATCVTLVWNYVLYKKLVYKTSA